MIIGKEIKKGLVPADGLIRNGLIAEYRMNEGIGDAFLDYSGQGNNAQLGSAPGVDTNDPAWNARGLSFLTDDFVDTQKVRMGNTGLFCDANEEFTVMLAGKFPLGSRGSILSNSPADFNDAVFHFNLVVGTNAWNLVKRGNIIMDPATYGNNDGNAHIHAFRWNKTNLIYFRDGVKIGGDLSVGTKPFVDTQRIMMGARTNGTGFLLTNGEIYYCAIWDKALSDNQLTSQINYIKKKLSQRGIAI